GCLGLAHSFGCARLRAGRVCFKERRHFTNLPSRSVARIDNESIGVDIAEPNEFLNRADSGLVRNNVRSSIRPTSPCRVAPPSALSTTFLDQSKRRLAAPLERTKPNPQVDRTKSGRRRSRPGVCAKTRDDWRLPPSIIRLKKMATVSAMAESRVSGQPATSKDCRCD